MPQLIVRNLEAAVVDRLREEAAREGVSVEEEHRRLLRRVLLHDPDGEAKSLKEYLLEMPDGGEAEDACFERVRSVGRAVDLS